MFSIRLQRIAAAKGRMVARFARLRLAVIELVQWLSGKWLAAAFAAKRNVHEIVVLKL